MAMTFVTSSVIWFILASPFAVWKLTNLALGTVGFFSLIAITHLILNRNKFQIEITRPKYTKTQIVFRAIITGFIIAIVVLLGKVLNPFWGGVFTMYPAATFGALVILHFYYEPRQLFYFLKKAPLGSLSLFIYAISVMVLFPKFGIAWGTLLAYGISLVIPIFLIKYRLK